MSEADEAAKHFIEERKRDYALCFGTPAGQRVLVDLTKFCRGAESFVVPGDRDRTYVLAGRLETWLRIEQHLNLTPDELFQLYAGRPSTGAKTDDRTNPDADT